MITLYFILIGMSWGADYYVSSSLGNDNNSGSVKSPWRSLAYVSKYLFYPGDKIFLKRGDIWLENFSFPCSGDMGAPVVLGSYGDGPLPIIKGGMPIYGWRLLGKRIFKAPRVYRATGFLEDGLPLRKASNPILSDGEWFDDYYNYYYRPKSGIPSDHLVEVNSKEDVLSIINKNNVLIDSIAISGASGSGLVIGGCNNIQVSNCVISSNANIGIKITSLPTGKSSDNVLIDNNVLVNNANGIYIVGDILSSNAANNVIIRNNNISYSNYNNVWHHRTKDGHAIGLQHINDSVIKGNEISYNYTGISLWSTPYVGANRNVFLYNFVHNNQRSGMCQGGEGSNSSTGNIWAYNVVAYNGYLPGDDGGFRINRDQLPSNVFIQNTLVGNDINIYLYSLTNNALLERNISYMPVLKHIKIEGIIGNNQFNNNLYYPDSENIFAVNKYKSLNFFKWKEITKEDRQSVCDNPLFIKNIPLNKEDYQPIAVSPVKGKGGKRKSDNLMIDFLNNPVPITSSIGAIEPLLK
jgi:hypothetical protein